ncbi:MAG TPA: NAD-dependent succinate-semialdehyde dehydrogenase [Opitutaceae bacterium]
MPLVSINPATGKRLRSYREHTPAQAAAALAQAHAAQQAWRELALADRGRHVHALAAQLREERETLAALITAEMGKPVTQARTEIEKCAKCCDFYALHAARLLKPERPLGAPKQARIVFEPVGVVLALMPWNFPFWQVFRAAAPALMAGNTVLLKHAPNTSGCALAIEQLFARAGVPAGLLRVALGGSELVAGLIADPRINAISLTGSTAAGRKIAALAGAHLKPCVFELGGSDPYVILGDADLAHAAEVCATARLVNNGQTCIGAKRCIVVERVRADFERLFLERMQARRTGDPALDSTEIGPLARSDLRETLHQQVLKSVRRGARLLLGGEIPAGRGNFYPPTVLTDVKKGMPAYDEELFGPVAAVITVKDEAEAIAVANDTVYGLGAAVFTRRSRRGREIATTQLEAGMVFVNEQVRSDVTLPFGGTKQSGYGRELGTYGIREFVNVKTVWVR